MPHVIGTVSVCLMFHVVHYVCLPTVNLRGEASPFMSSNSLLPNTGLEIY